MGVNSQTFVIRCPKERHDCGWCSELNPIPSGGGKPPRHPIPTWRFSECRKFVDGTSVAIVGHIRNILMHIRQRAFLIKVTVLFWTVLGPLFDECVRPCLTPDWVYLITKSCWVEFLVQIQANKGRAGYNIGFIMSISSSRYLNLKFSIFWRFFFSRCRLKLKKPT